MTTLLDSWQFGDMDDLAKIINDAKFRLELEPGAGSTPVVYVGTDTEEPTQFGTAQLIKTVLTDGSIVFDLRLS
jgi:hypothetical protein